MRAKLQHLLLQAQPLWQSQQGGGDQEGREEEEEEEEGEGWEPVGPQGSHASAGSVREQDEFDQGERMLEVLNV